MEGEKKEEEKEKEEKKGDRTPALRAPQRWRGAALPREPLADGGPAHSQDDIFPHSRRADKA